MSNIPTFARRTANPYFGMMAQQRPTTDDPYQVKPSDKTNKILDRATQIAAAEIAATGSAPNSNAMARKLKAVGLNTSPGTLETHSRWKTGKPPSVPTEDTSQTKPEAQGRLPKLALPPKSQQKQPAPKKPKKSSAGTGPKSPASPQIKKEPPPTPQTLRNSTKRPAEDAEDNDFKPPASPPNKIPKYNPFAAKDWDLFKETGWV
jgi:hypothetical protein